MFKELLLFFMVFKLYFLASRFMHFRNFMYKCLKLSKQLYIYIYIYKNIYIYVSRQSQSYPPALLPPLNSQSPHPPPHKCQLIRLFNIQFNGVLHYFANIWAGPIVSESWLYACYTYHEIAIREHIRKNNHKTTTNFKDVLV